MMQIFIQKANKPQKREFSSIMKHLQPKKMVSFDRGQATVPSIVHEVLQSSGESLDSATRSFMEPCFGHDFSNVRIHSDSQAAESAQAVDALAYTAGRHLVFGKGQYSPATEYGRRLLAHELVHSIQQGFAVNPFPQIVGNSKNSLERRADEVADLAVKGVLHAKAGNGLSISPTMQTQMLQRKEGQAPELRFPPSEEETSMRVYGTEHETVPPDCRENSLVLSWEEDTCCSNRGFPDPDAKNKTTGATCCNVFPRFVDLAATKHGFDGAASCKPEYKGYSAVVTPNDKSRPAVKVICTDTRANSRDVIELGETAATKAYGSTHLRERAKVCYGAKEVETCYFETDCNKTKNPKESQCMPAGCSKTGK
jgi:hypothetical protein